MAQAKWDKTHALSKRGSTKTKLKQELQDMLTEDPDCKDAYWTTDIENVHKESTKRIGVWTLRARVDCLLGGKEKTQEAIDNGYY